MIEPVDAVIAWVDGYDPAHQAKLAKKIADLGIEKPESAEPTRYNQKGEVDYCVWSILRFAPWIRTIYIVSDAQCPGIMSQLKGTPYEHRVKLIDHQEIFAGFEQYLPTFNSLTIESAVWRIKGLANQFIYFNDDCSFIQPVRYEDFFRDQKIVLRGNWKTFSAKKWRHHPALLRLFPRLFEPTPPYRQYQENSAQLAGWKKHYFYLQHLPLPIKKNTLEAFFDQSPHYLSDNIQYPFRVPQQFWAMSVAQHLDIMNNQVIFDNALTSITVNAGFHATNKIEQRLAHADRKKSVAFVCIQSLDEGSPSLQARLLQWLDKRIPPLAT